MAAVSLSTEDGAVKKKKRQNSLHFTADFQVEEWMNRICVPHISKRLAFEAFLAHDFPNCYVMFSAKIKIGNHFLSKDLIEKFRKSCSQQRFSLTCNFTL